MVRGLGWTMDVVESGVLAGKVGGGGGGGLSNNCGGQEQK